MAGIKLMPRSGFLVLSLFISLTLPAQTVLPLYDDVIPNSRPHKNMEYMKANRTVDSLTYKVSVPTLKVFLPKEDRNNRTAVIICPGGGYGGLLTKREGSDVAARFRDMGVAAFVLKYRIPEERTMKNPSIGPLQDLQTALKIVRNRADEWGIDPSKIGVMGFSAGGHLAASGGVHHDNYWVDSTMGKVNVRPDFMLLVNPVISFTESIGHLGSRDNLLGKNPSSEQVRFFSNELHVDAETPPAFLIHNSTDSVVLVENSLRFFEEMRKQGTQAEIHIYGKGEHGFLTWPLFDEWFGRCVNWMEGMDLMHARTNRPIEFSKYLPADALLMEFYGFRGYDFSFRGRKAKIVMPDSIAEGHPWIWRARFWGHEPQTDLALLERGFHVVYCDVSELFGNEEALSIWNDYYQFLTHAGLSSKSVMEGMSRGGFYVYRWAATYPERVAAIYADAPVLDIKSWPGGKGSSPGSRESWEVFKKDFNYLSEEEALNFTGNPLDQTGKIALAGFPMLHVVGDADKVVPVSENTTPFEKKIRELGGIIQVIHKPEVGHHPHSLEDPQPIVDFILRAVER